MPSDGALAELQQVGAVVYAPVGRDAALIAGALASIGVEAQVLTAIQQLCEVAAASGPVVAIVTEEALPHPSVEQLQHALAQQPPWSDLPLIVLTSAGTTTEQSLRRFFEMETLGHVTMLERPLRSVTLIAAVRSAIRSRMRQFQMRDYLAERTRTEQELSRQAQQLARSNADLQQFAYVTSHDLREPLRNINLYAQFVHQRFAHLLPEEAQRYLSIIEAGADRMEMLINDLLVYSRVLNTADIPFRRVSLNAVIDWAKANLERAIAESGTEVTSSELPTVTGDELQLVQLFQNLLSNAIKYRREGVRNRIQISAVRNASHWRVQIRDNGLGFRPEYKDRIFGLFKRLHGPTIPGTGIGLSICKGIIERHGGSIEADSIPGEGSTFEVTFPISEP